MPLSFFQLHQSTLKIYHSNIILYFSTMDRSLFNRICIKSGEVDQLQYNSSSFEFKIAQKFGGCSLEAASPLSKKDSRSAMYFGYGSVAS